MKPFKGRIIGERVNTGKFLDIYPKNLGYIIIGKWVDHPVFLSSFGRTSLVVRKGRWKNDACEIETLNSRYIWVRDVDN